ncbi:serine/threonine-protein kinase [Streptomyces uncialis]|uniref:Protein kinase domain-containing protein n=1 Tax=Streptomyces uncialis TaxID=1048205 RepID=A0A1Q4VAI0_9ACTN|nr:serine/threonine-protein kinase [Streptomyces uncialis]OKH94858.1 hypothetical protein AB852_11945 [Streptomyces uncialis]
MERLSGEDPRTVGSYALVGRLGAGGMGRVYLGRDARGQWAAVKMIRPELAVDGEFRRRFAREVEAARTASSPWTVRVLGADTQAAVPWVATVYFPSISLQDATERFGPLPGGSVRALAFGLAQALDTLHRRSLIHRDVKPSNVLLGLDGPALIDFGIARAVEGGRMTGTGVVVGSPGFMSPEQLTGASITGASDVFCLGLVLAFAATGRTPFTTADDSGVAGLLAVLSQAPDLYGITGGLRDLVRSCLDPEPSQRPTSADIMHRTRDTATRGSRSYLPPDIAGHVDRLASRLHDPDLLSYTLDTAPTVVPYSPTAPAFPAGVPQPPGPPGRPPPPLPPLPPAPAAGYGPTAAPGRTADRQRVVVLGLTTVVLLLAGALTGVLLMRQTDPGTGLDGGSPPRPAPTAGSSAPPGDTALGGTWRGTVEQDNGLSYPVKAVFPGTELELGEPVATVDYPTLECGGEWVLESRDGGELVVREQLDSNRANRCDHNIPIELTLTPAGTLRYFFEIPAVGRAVLRRD